MTQLTLSAQAGGPALFEMRLGLNRSNLPPLTKPTTRLATLATLVLAVPAFYVLAWVIAQQVGWSELAPGLLWGRLFEICTPLSVLTAMVAIARVHIERGGKTFALQATVQLHRWLVALAVFGLIFGGMFYAHLVFDGLACARGITSAC